MIYEKKKYGDKNIIPAGLLYYNIQDPIVEAKKDDDEVEALIRKELRMKGVVNSNKNIISMMDSTEVHLLIFLSVIINLVNLICDTAGL